MLRTLLYEEGFMGQEEVERGGGETERVLARETESQRDHVTFCDQ